MFFIPEYSREQIIEAINKITEAESLRDLWDRRIELQSKYPGICNLPEVDESYIVINDKHVPKVSTERFAEMKKLKEIGLMKSEIKTLEVKKYKAAEGNKSKVEKLLVKEKEKLKGLVNK